MQPEHIRASDADRDKVAERLREALAEGRLTPVEHEERIDTLYKAKTMGELKPITEDLPTSGEGLASRPNPEDPSGMEIPERGSGSRREEQGFGEPCRRVRRL